MGSIHTMKTQHTQKRRGDTTRTSLENMTLGREAKHKGSTVCDSTYTKCPKQANPETGSRLADTGHKERQPTLAVELFPCAHRGAQYRKLLR